VKEMKIIPSQYFIDMVDEVYKTLLFKRSKPFAVFSWIILPVLPVMILGWYIAEVLDF
jgi:hypothetical protein